MDVTVRPLTESDLPAAARIIPLAFGTFLGVSELDHFWSDIDYAGTRWRAEHTRSFGCEMGGEIVGSNFVTRWGSVGFFGPLTVRPDLWDQGIGKRLIEPAMDCFDRWKTRPAGLYTFAQSSKHVGLYQKFGFWPRFLTAIMSKPVRNGPSPVDGSLYSKLPQAARGECLDQCRELTDRLYEGLDLTGEIRAVETQRLGETLLLWDDGKLVGLAVCHCGVGTEAGKGQCYVKFGAVRSGLTAGELFGRLLDDCEALAAARGMSRLKAGVNLARHEAYRKMLEQGFRTETQGVTMHRPNEPGYSRPEVFLIDDWR